MATRWFQKSRLDRNPPRKLPTSSVPLVDPDRRSHMFLFKLKAFCSELSPSRLAQLDCLTFTKGSLVETSDVDNAGGLGTGSGGVVVILDNEALSRGRAPLEDGKVRLESCSEALRLTVGLGKISSLLLDLVATRLGFFCFSKCSAMASTSAKVESSWVLSSRFEPEELKLSCEVESLASIEGLKGRRLLGAMACKEHKSKS